MARLGYQDFYFRLSSPGRTRVKAIPESKEAFLKRIDQFLNKEGRRVINVETHETFTRVWYTEEQ